MLTCGHSLPAAKGCPTEKLAPVPSNRIEVTSSTPRFSAAALSGSAPHEEHARETAIPKPNPVRVRMPASSARDTSRDTSIGRGVWGGAGGPASGPSLPPGRHPPYRERQPPSGQPPAESMTPSSDTGRRLAAVWFADI